MTKEKKVFYKDLRLSARVVGVVLLIIAILFAMGDMLMD
jgi:hypothetical protein